MAKTERTKMVGVRLTEQEFEKLKAIATTQCRSKAAQFRYWLQVHVAPNKGGS